MTVQTYNLQNIKNLVQYLIFCVLALSAPNSIKADNTDDNVNKAIDVIVLFCVAGGEKYEIVGSGDLDAGISLRKKDIKFGAKGDIKIKKKEMRGFVDALNSKLNQFTGKQASEARECMKPYIDRIINILLPDSAILGAPANLSQQVENTKELGKGNTNVPIDIILKGKITDKNNKPVNNALVTIKNHPEFNTYTNSKGEYQDIIKIKKLNTPIELRVVKKGYFTDDSNILVDGKEKELNITLIERQ